MSTKFIQHLFLLMLVTGVIACPTMQGKEKTSEPTFERFRHEKNGWKILDDALVKKRLKSIMGNRDQDFWGCAQLADEPTITGDDLLVVSSVRGLRPFMQSVLSLNLSSGACNAAYLNDSQWHIFGAHSLNELSPALRNYLKEQDASSSTVYEKADWTPVKTTVPLKKKLNLAVVTGTYQRQDSSRFVAGTLSLLALAGGRITFDIEAQNGGHGGGVQGTVPVVNHRAVYRQGTGELEFQLKGKEVVVSGTDAPFCGMGVTLLGTYEKVDDEPPKLDK
jgi:hypothetical protein